MTFYEATWSNIVHHKGPTHGSAPITVSVQETAQTGQCAYLVPGECQRKKSE